MRGMFTPTVEMINAAKEYLDSKNEVESIKPVVAEIQSRILLKNNWANPIDGVRIIEPKESWLMSEMDFEVFWAQVHNEYLAHGFSVGEYGFCPLLIAEKKLCAAKRKLNDAMQSVSEISHDDAICSKDGLKNLEELTSVNIKLMTPFVELLAKGGTK